MRLTLAILLVAVTPLARGENAQFSPEELSKFLGPVSPNVIHWRPVGGPDFVVYLGEAQPPLSGHVGFYIGGAPNFRPEPGSTTFKGRLGIFAVKWYRKITPDGSISQNALVDLDYFWKADVNVTANSQSNVDQLIAIVSQLPTFTKKPKRIPGMPQTMLEYYCRPIIGTSVFLISFAIFIIGGSLLNRRWLRKRKTLTRRSFYLAAYSGLAIIGYAGAGVGTLWMLRNTSDAARGFLIG